MWLHGCSGQLLGLGCGCYTLSKEMVVLGSAKAVTWLLLVVAKVLLCRC